MFGQAKSQSFYDIQTIQTIELHFGQSNWDYMMDTAKAGSGSYIMADSININGTSMDSVGVRYKGNSSYSSNRIKNPIHIELDHFKEAHIYDGITDIKLNNGFKDPSLVRETVSYHIAGCYMAVPKANYARLYINGQFIGIYTNVESITKKFVNSRFGSNDNTFFKCNPVYSSMSKSNLAYLGPDSASYYNSYEMKSNSGWNDMVNLCSILNNNPNNINSILDIDRALWMLAFNNLLVNLDSYTGAISQNYYLYKADNNCFNSILWDLNESFGSFNNSGTGPPLNITQMQQLTPMLHLNNTERPLIQKLLNVPIYKKMYMAHFKTIYKEFFVNNQYLSLANSYQSIIDASVQADANKLYSYSDFINNISQTVSSGPMQIPGITLLMNGRKNYLSTQTDMQYSQPDITNITLSDTLPEMNDNIFVNATVQNGSYVLLGYRFNQQDRFTRIQMYDDGNHGDGAAADGIFGVQIQIGSPIVQYYIYAENANAGKFSPERAEYEYYTIFSSHGNIEAGQVVINELMAINTVTVSDPNNQFEDWIELYNNTNTYISLKGAYLSDSYTNPYKWLFPDNTFIEPYGYLLIWADNDTTQQGLHANFKLSGAGEQVILSYNSGYIIDDISFSEQISDISFGRYPNGTGSFTYLTPTPMALNQPMAIDEHQTNSIFSMYPLPAQSYVFISGSIPVSQIKIFDVNGRIIENHSFSGAFEIKLPTEHLLPGCYILMMNNTYPLKLIKL